MEKVLCPERIIDPEHWRPDGTCRCYPGVNEHEGHQVVVAEYPTVEYEMTGLESDFDLQVVTVYHSRKGETTEIADTIIWCDTCKVHLHDLSELGYPESWSWDTKPEQ